MTAESRARFAQVMSADEPDLALACLLIGAEVRPDLDVDEFLRLLDGLAERAITDVRPAAPAFDIAQGLRAVLADGAGFRGYGDDYGDLRASLLHEVLRRRRGLPILLSVVYIEVGRRLGIGIDGYGLPGHFVVGVTGEDGATYLDPFYGGRLVTPVELSTRVSGILGENVVLGEDHLHAWTPRDIVTRVLGNIRLASRSPDALRTRLWACELSLLVPGAATGLRRERAELLARLGDFAAASDEFARYGEAIAPLDPEAAEQALAQARTVLARLN